MRTSRTGDGGILHTADGATRGLQALPAWVTNSHIKNVKGLVEGRRGR